MTLGSQQRSYRLKKQCKEKDATKGEQDALTTHLFYMSIYLMTPKIKANEHTNLSFFIYKEPTPKFHILQQRSFHLSWHQLKLYVLKFLKDED